MEDGKIIASLTARCEVTLAYRGIGDASYEASNDMCLYSRDLSGDWNNRLETDIKLIADSLADALLKGKHADKITLMGFGEGAD